MVVSHDKIINNFCHTVGQNAQNEMQAGITVVHADGNDSEGLYKMFFNHLNIYDYKEKKIISEDSWKKLISNPDVKEDKDDSGETDSDFLSLRTDLIALDDWYEAYTQTANEPIKNCRQFISYYQDAVLGAYCRYRNSKAKAWSKKRNILMILSSALVPVLASLVLQFVTEADKTLLTSTGLIIACAIATVWMGSHVYSEMQSMNSYRETWVRHSACYGRLRLVLSRFLTSKRDEESYWELVENTFSVLDQNYSQFVLNLSSSGLAEKPETD